MHVRRVFLKVMVHIKVIISREHRQDQYGFQNHVNACLVLHTIDAQVLEWIYLSTNMYIYTIPYQYEVELLVAQTQYQGIST